MERNRVQLYLLWLLAGILLVGCTAEPVEEIVPEESRPVAPSVSAGPIWAYLNS